MRKAAKLAFFLLFYAISAHAQTVVTGTILDSFGNPYANGTISGTLSVSTGQTPSVNPSTGAFPLNNQGAFSFTITPNTAITPAGSQWVFTICAPPVALGPTVNNTPTLVCFNSPALSISASSPQNIGPSIGVGPQLGPPPSNGSGNPNSGQVIASPQGSVMVQPNAGLQPVAQGSNITVDPTGNNIKVPGTGTFGSAGSPGSQEGALQPPANCPASDPGTMRFWLGDSTNNLPMLSINGAACFDFGTGVSSWSGDGVIFNNSASTGAVTATRASIAGHTFLGNNTGSSTTIGAVQPACADLSNAAPSCNTDATNANNLSSGTVACGRMPAMTGDATSPAGSCGLSVVRINGVAVPNSSNLLGSNSSGQLVNLETDLGALTYNSGGTTTFAAGGAFIAGGSVTVTHATSTTFSPTGLVKWGHYTLIIKQDGTGGGTTFTLGTAGTCSAWKIAPSGILASVALSQIANGIDLLEFTYDGTNCVAKVSPQGQGVWYTLPAQSFAFGAFNTSATTTMVPSAAANAGLYRIDVYLIITTTFTGCTTPTVRWNYTDASGANHNNDAVGSVTAGAFADGPYNFQSTGATAVTWQPTASGSCTGGAATALITLTQVQ